MTRADGTLRIALLAHIRHPIARPFMGGMEAHAFHLANALSERGHAVTLFASGDSDAGVPLSPVIPVHYDRDLPWHRWHGSDRLNEVLDTAFADLFRDFPAAEFDVVHNNSLHRFPMRWARKTGMPMVTSLHVPPFEALFRAVHDSEAPWNWTTVCSDRQRAMWWPDGAPAEAVTVPNGIALGDWSFVPKGDGSAVWAGRITPNKGAHLAIEAAQILGIDLTLYGVVEHRDYFETRIAPHLSDSIRYGGHLSQPELAWRVGRASVFLFTPLWDEPFGLSAVEAMACGVPVAAIPGGAVAEVVGPGGVIAAEPSGKALSVAALQAMAIPRKRVSGYAGRMFSIRRMVEDYERLYRKAVAARPTEVPPVRYDPWELPDTDTALERSLT